MTRVADPWEQAAELAHTLACNWGNAEQRRTRTMFARHGEFTRHVDVRVRNGLVVAIARTMTARDWLPSQFGHARMRFAVVFEEARHAS